LAIGEGVRKRRVRRVKSDAGGARSAADANNYEHMPERWRGRQQQGSGSSTGFVAHSASEWVVVALRPQGGGKLPHCKKSGVPRMRRGFASR
jgi:hypothetical protein